jgi:hypothetical protein
MKTGILIYVTTAPPPLIKVKKIPTLQEATVLEMPATVKETLIVTVMLMDVTHLTLNWISVGVSLMTPVLL